MSSPFAAPASATGIRWESIKGALVLIEVSSVEQGIKTAYGDTDAVRADVIVLDGPSTGEEYRDTLVFPRVLRSQLAPNVGKKVLGRVGQGQAKPGQSAPWLILEATAADQQVGLAYLNKNQLAAPAPAAAGATSAPPF